MANLAVDNIKGTLKAAFSRAAQITGLDKPESKLRVAFRNAQIVGNRALGIAGALVGAAVGDAQSANYSLQAGEFNAQKAKVKKELDKGPQ